MKQTPHLMQSPLTNQWYIVTRWREREGVDTKTGERTRYMVALEKFDVSDQMRAILKAAQRKRRKP
jgi:hypothetical protein